MAVTAAQFKAAHPEFANVLTPEVEAKLADAALLCPESVWGDFTDQGVRYRAARLLALAPMGRDVKLVNKDGSTIYDEQIDLLVKIVSSGGRVI